MPRVPLSFIAKMTSLNAAKQLVIDMYGCDKAILNSHAQIVQAAHHAIKEIGASIVDECVHTFSPIGITYFAVITSSHLSIHTWPEYGYAAVDIFSCAHDVPDSIGEMLKASLHAENIQIRTMTRNIGYAQT